jgi:hypothetical protein
MSDEAIRQRERSARERAAHNKRVFDRASFSPYALDARWVGLRWFGGHAGSDGQTENLVLAHGDNPWEVASPQVRVETHAIGSAGGSPNQTWRVARQLVQHFWLETGVLPDDVRRAVFTTADRSTADPTAPWEPTELTIDQTKVAFRVLAHDDFWVGVGSRSDLVVGVQARGWQLEQTGIVTVDDLTPYLEGSVESAMRWRPSKAAPK